MKINWIIIFFQKNKQQQNITIRGRAGIKTEPRQHSALPLFYPGQPQQMQLMLKFWS